MPPLFADARLGVPRNSIFRCMRRDALRVIVSKNINPPGTLGLRSLTENPRSGVRDASPEIQK